MCTFRSDLNSWCFHCSCIWAGWRFLLWPRQFYNSAMQLKAAICIANWQLSLNDRSQYWQVSNIICLPSPGATLANSGWGSSVDKNTLQRTMLRWPGGGSKTLRVSCVQNAFDIKSFVKHWIDVQSWFKMYSIIMYLIYSDGHRGKDWWI